VLLGGLGIPAGRTVFNVRSPAASWDAPRAQLFPDIALDDPGHFAMHPMAKGVPANVGDPCAQRAAQTNIFEVAPQRERTGQIGSLPSSPRLVSSAKVEGTPVEGLENRETGYATPDEFDELGLEPSSWNGASRQVSWDDPAQEQSYSCVWGPEEACAYSVVDPCVWQDSMVPNVAQFPIYQFQNGHCASGPSQSESIEGAPQEHLKSVDWGSTVTVMMRNLPKKLSQSLLMEEIRSKGFGDSYDFVYVPMDKETKSNRGYAFINFVEPKYAMAFKSCYEGHQLTKYSSRKVIAILPAALQGFDANHAHFASLRVVHDAPGARPVFLRQPSALQGGPLEAQEGGRNGLTKSAALVCKSQFPARPPADASNLPAGKGKHALNFCPFCGGDAQRDFKFCQYCGASLQL